jgi:hypothetical protein
MNDPRIDVLSGQQLLFNSSEQDGEQRSSAPGTAPRIRIEPRPNLDARVGNVVLQQRLRRASACRELKRLVRARPADHEGRHIVLNSNGRRPGP